MPSQTAKQRRKASNGVAPDGRANATESGDDHDDGADSHVRRHDRRPLKSYAGIMASYGTLSVVLAVVLRRKRLRMRPLSPWNLALYALAAEHVSRLISKDSVTSPVRSPFTEFKEPAGEGESNEEVIGNGTRHAIGELLTCPFCLDQWVATGLIAGSVAVPTLTTAVVSVSAVARAADYLHLLYGWLREEVEG